MAIGDVYRVTPVWVDNDAGGPSMTSHFDVVQLDAVHDPASVMSTIYDWWTSGLDGNPAQCTHHGSSVGLTAIELRRIRPLEDLIVFSAESFPVAGSGSTNQSLPPNSSVVASLRTDLIGRRNRGRMFLPPYSESDVNGNVDETEAQETADNLLAVQAALGALTNQYSWVVYSKTYDEVQAITTVKVDRRCRVQRRRQPSASYVTSA